MLNWVNALPAHFDTASSGHPRKRRRRTNREELEILEEAFAKNLLPDATTRQELGERLGMSVRAVQIWFQNKRQTLRKKSISSSGGHPLGLGSDDDMMFRSDDGESSRHSPRRRSSGDSAASSSPPRSSPTCESGVARRTLTRGSRSCSSLLSSSPPSLASQRDSQTLLRAETCSSLPTTVSSLSSSLKMSSLRSPTPTKSATDMDAVVTEAREPSPHAEEVIVKTEVIESSPRDILVAVAESVKDIVDVKTADMHLCMLLEEAKRRSGQAVKPVMGLWSETSNKPALNAPVSGTFPRTTATFPTPKRTMSMPCTNIQQNARSHPKPSRKHRSMPDPTTLSTLHHSCMPYSRTQSLMEQVINRQQQHHHHHYRRPTPSNFKQSALSASKHSLDSTAHKALKASPRIAASTELSPTALARPPQHTVSSNLKRVQSESVLHERGARTGQTAMRARRLSFGKFLFDTDEDTDEEIPFCNKKVPIPSPPTTPADAQSMQRRTSSQQELTHQAQKRRAGTPATPTRTPGRAQLVDGDETDEEDFVALNKRSAFKRLNLAKDFSSPAATCSFVPLQHSLQGGSRKHDWTKTHKLSPRTSLKPSLSTLSLVRSSPTRQYAFEMERSRSPLTSYPILERNRAWNGSLSPNSESTQHHLHHHHASAPTTSVSTVTPEILNAPAMEETKDLNMDELECASVLAGLGWGH
ncbi:hypothetical protein BGZ99_003266 [Dissophora globulifera]|uniref:Homeobox domain-containing protein n=1 Tax=Dissophora globulifera TaxID=979702 RepID=A0A9P6RQK5_9FUNG|nr:hypothetical protein BGZ99_003266 [Dissophora globulifera]